MTSSSNGQPPRLRTRVVLTVAAAIVAGIVGGFLIVALLRHQPATGQPTAPTTSAPATSNAIPSSAAPQSLPATSTPTSNSADPVTGNLADGCLGGANSFTAVLAAQKAATPDNLGAAAFARTVARWSAAYPSDPNAAAVLAKLQAPGTVFAQAALAKTAKADADLKAQGYVSARVLPNLGQYRVLNGVTTGGQPGATIEVQIYRELTNSANQTSQAKLTTELVLRLVNGVWVVVGSPPTVSTVPTSAVPWQSYAGAC